MDLRSGENVRDGRRNQCEGRMTQAEEVGLGSIVEVEKGEDGGFSVKYRDGSRGFFVGEVGEEIWRKWKEARDE